MSAFLCQGETSRKQKLLLGRTRTNGLPDTGKYYWTCCLTRIMDWNLHHLQKDWISLIQLFSPIPLVSTLHAMHAMRCLTLPIKGQMSSIKFKPEFSPGLAGKFLEDHRSNPRGLVRYLFENDPFFLGRKQFFSRSNCCILKISYKPNTILGLLSSQAFFWPLWE